MARLPNSAICPPVTRRVSSVVWLISCSSGGDFVGLTQFTSAGSLRAVMTGKVTKSLAERE